MRDAPAGPDQAIHTPLAAADVSDSVKQRRAARKAERARRKQFDWPLSRPRDPANDTAAVFILPPPMAKDSLEKPAAMALRDELNAANVPAFVIGDTAGTTADQVVKNVRTIQDRNHFRHVTILSMTHGEIYDTRSKQVVGKIDDDADDETRRRIIHRTVLSRDPPFAPTTPLMRDITAAAQAKSVDWFTINCKGGKIEPWDLDSLTGDVTYISLCGENQLGSFSVMTSMTRALRDKNFAKSVRGIDLLDKAIEADWRRYNSDIVIGFSKESRIITFPSLDNEMSSLKDMWTNSWYPNKKYKSDNPRQQVKYAAWKNGQPD